MTPSPDSAIKPIKPLKERDQTMSLINKEISDFSAQAYQNGEFRTVTKQDVLGKWSLFFFYPQYFTFVCPTELVGFAEQIR